MKKHRLKIAILDDYQQVALQLADWSAIAAQAEVTVFTEHLATQAQVIEKLRPFNVLCVMRERTPLTREILQALPNLRLIVSTGQRNLSIDQAAAAELGIALRFTRYLDNGAPEMTWALLLALARRIPKENERLKRGGWQGRIGTDLTGKTLGIIGLGRVGQRIARYARAFDMDVLAWSPNLTASKAAAIGAHYVSKSLLLEHSDFVSLHMVLSESTRGLLQAADLALMKPSAFLINTSRGPLVDEAALIDCLWEERIAGAALDVFDTEPLPPDHLFRKLSNVLATPHIGYVTENTYRQFYGDTVAVLADWLQEFAPMRWKEV